MTASNYLFQKSPLPMWVFHTKTLNFLAVNDAAVCQYGYTREEFLKMTIQAIHAGANGEETEGSFKHSKKNGDLITVHIDTSLIEFETQPARMVVISDITAQLKLNAERYDIISKATSDTVRDWNLLTGEIIWNKGIKGIFGYKNLIENMTSSDWWALRIHPKDRERVTGNIQTHIRDRIARWQDEYRFACADGSYKYVLDRGFMVFNENGVSVRMLGSMQDISQRKQEEQWSRLLESVVINATDAVLITTGNVEGSGQSIIYVNEAYTRMSGYHKSELIGSSPRISQGPGTDLDELKKLKEAIENRVPCEIEVINYTKTGQEYWVSQSNAPVLDSSGEVTHWISIQRDITQNKKHLRKIEEQNKKFKEIEWIQSHLVRAPLARIMGLVELLKDFEPGDDKDELLLHLTNSANELDSIIINIADKNPAGNS